MIAAIGNDTKKMYGLQFHPEVSTYGNILKKSYFHNKTERIVFMLGEFN
jgi:GMP synthase-like glutamine amidotransferase